MPRLRIEQYNMQTYQDNQRKASISYYNRRKEYQEKPVKAFNDKFEKLIKSLTLCKLPSKFLEQLEQTQKSLSESLEKEIESPTTIAF